MGQSESTSALGADIYAGSVFGVDFVETVDGRVINHVSGDNSFVAFADAMTRSAALDGNHLYLYTDLAVSANPAVSLDTRLALDLGGNAAAAALDCGNFDWTVTRTSKDAGLVIGTGISVTGIDDFTGVGYGNRVYTTESILTIQAGASLSAKNVSVTNETYSRITVGGTLTVSGNLAANSAISVTSTGVVNAGTLSVDGVASDIAAGAVVTVSGAMYLNRLNLAGNLSASASNFFNQTAIAAGATLSAGVVSFGSTGYWSISCDAASTISYSYLAANSKTANLYLSVAAGFAAESLQLIVAQNGSGSALDYNNTNVTVSGADNLWFVINNGNLYLTGSAACDRSKVALDGSWSTGGYSFGDTLTLGDGSRRSYGVNAFTALASAFMAVSAGAGEDGELLLLADCSLSSAALFSKSAGTITVQSQTGGTATVNGSADLTVSVGGTVCFADNVKLNLAANSLTVNGGTAVFAGALTVGGSLATAAGATLVLRHNIVMSRGSVSNQGTLVFDLSGRTAADGALISQTSGVNGGAYSVVTADRQLSGVYVLATGLSAFGGTINVLDPANHVIGSVALGQSVTDLRGRQYALSLSNNELKLTVTGDDSAPVLAGLPQVSAAADGKVSISWTGAVDNTAVTGYKLVIDGGAAIDVGNVLSYTLDLDWGAHSCRLAAYDLAGNVSNYSELEAFEITDGVAPHAPAGLSAQVSGSSAALDWQDASDNVGVTSYLVRCGTTSDLSGDGVTVSASSDLLQNLAYGKYYWQVAAVDDAGNRSSWSQVGEFQVKAVALPYNFTGQISGQTLQRLGEFELSAGKYSFNGTFAANAKVMLYDVKNNNKILAAATVDKTGKLVWKTPLLLNFCTYELGVISADKGKIQGAFTVTAAGEVFKRANLVADDDWHLASAGSVGVGGSVDDWVGYSDKIDYRKLDIAVSGIYNFNLSNLQNAVKLTVYTVTAKGALQVVKSIAVTPKFDKQGNVTGNSSGALDALLLSSGKPYYLAVEATGAAKGANSDYLLNLGGTLFDNAKNALANNNWGDAGVATLDLANGLADEWVGYGDAVDFYQFQLSGGAKSYRFTLDADVGKAAVLTVYQATQKNGKTVLTLLKADKNGNLALGAGNYAVKIASADNGKGLKNTGYSLAVNLA